MSTDPATLRLAQADHMAREIVAIADDVSRDYVDKPAAKNTDEAKRVVDREAIARAKLRIDVRMWLMARYAPQVYGGAAPKTSDTDPPVSFEIHTTVEEGE